MVLIISHISSASSLADSKGGQRVDFSVYRRERNQMAQDPLRMLGEGRYNSIFFQFLSGQHLSGAGRHYPHEEPVASEAQGLD
jgi:hypothetical protein